MRSREGVRGGEDKKESAPKALSQLHLIRRDGGARVIGPCVCSTILDGMSGV